VQKLNLNQNQVINVESSFDEASNLFVIKLPSALSDHFSDIFEQLDKKETHIKLNIKNYNVRVTSLEEVFNTIGE
jgi:hypothetical protein